MDKKETHNDFLDVFRSILRDDFMSGIHTDIALITSDKKVIKAIHMK